MEFNQYRDENNKFINESFVYFSQTNAYGILSLCELLKMTTDLAVEDYNQQGMSRQFLKDHNIAILVSRVAYRIHKWPRENQPIKVVTWEEKPESIHLMRNYQIYDREDNLLISGKSAWMVVDLGERKILPADSFDLRKPCEVVSEMDCMSPGRIPITKDAELAWTRKIGFSDLDTNGHTTNSRYGAFVADAIPAEYKNKEPKDFRLNYSKEAMLGETLSVYVKKNEEKNMLQFIGRTEESISFQAELYF